MILFLSLSSANDALPFDDDIDPGAKYGSDFTVLTPSPSPTPLPTPPFPPIPISRLFRQREFLFFEILLIYAAFFWFGRRSVRRVEQLLKDTIMARFRNYYAAVPERFVKTHPHRMAAFATGRVCHKGVLVTLDLTKRCDPLGFVLSLLRNAKSVLAFEFLVDPQYEVPCLLHVSAKKPGYAGVFKLSEFVVSDERLKCFTDLEDHRHGFLTMLNGFMERYRGVIKQVEISDVNRFELMGECRFVVRLEFEFGPKNEDVVLSEEIAEFGMSIADKFATLKMDGDVIARNNQTRQAALRSVKEKQKRD
jgi:hypothetical protein